MAGSKVRLLVRASRLPSLHPTADLALGAESASPARAVRGGGGRFGCEVAGRRFLAHFGLERN